MEKTFCFITGSRTVVLPVTPERAHWEKAANVESVNISAVGDVYLPGKAKRYRGEIEGMFPANAYSWIAAGASTEPYTYISFFTGLMNAGTPVRFVVGGTDINAQVLIEGIEYEEKDASGDVYYTLTIAEWVELEAVTVQTADTAGSAGTTGNGTQSAETGAQQYTIVSGDMLSVICRRFYGNGGAKYYNALAKYNGIKNPHLIYPGNTITIPAESDLFGGVTG